MVMGDFANNPLISLTGLWEEGDVLGTRAGLQVRRAGDDKCDYEIVVGDSVLGRMWKNDKGRAAAGGSFLNLKCMMFKNDNATGSQPQFSLSVCKREVKPDQQRASEPAADGDESSIPF
jgi:hypothetical protein